LDEHVGSLAEQGMHVGSLAEQGMHYVYFKAWIDNLSLFLFLSLSPFRSLSLFLSLRYARRQRDGCGIIKASSPTSHTVKQKSSVDEPLEHLD
jgi:hypothetical protein